MLELTYAQIIEDLRLHPARGLPKLSLTVLRNVTLELIEPYLQYLGRRAGFDTEVRFGAYDAVLQEAVSGSPGLLGESTDIVLVFLRLEALNRNLARAFPALDSGRLQQELDSVAAYAESVLSGIRKQTAAAVLWHGFELPAWPALGVYESRKGLGQRATVAALNERIGALLESFPDAYLVDLELCRSRVGERRYFDPRYWHMARAPYTNEALREIALEDFKIIRALKGKNRKCLVLDCDNTLWGGIVGEDGLEGIRVGTDYPGSPYYELQQEALNLFHRGVILALCSRNNEADVWEVFDKHPGMLLKKEHFAAWRIDWEDKATGLRSLARELNIGTDSLVLADDSEFEINLVRSVLPEVEAIQLSSANPGANSRLLAECGLFDTLALSEEDRKRGSYYSQDAERRRHQQQFTSLDQYLASLEMSVTVGRADSACVGRIAQLTQRTNQFNLTTKRYSEDEIGRLAADRNAAVYYVSLADRFGELGTIGACILTIDGPTAAVDTLLMSCRALGRGVEDLFLAEIARLCLTAGLTRLVGLYRPTAKNSQVAGFYPDRGFRALPEKAGDDTAAFELDLTSAQLPRPAYFKQVTLKTEATQDQAAT